MHGRFDEFIWGLYLMSVNYKKYFDNSEYIWWQIWSVQKDERWIFKVSKFICSEVFYL